MIKIVILAIAYAISGKLGLALAIPPGYATALFPASGIALAVGLVYGYRVIPGVWLGSFLLNIWVAYDSFGAITPTNISIGALIAFGATLQAIAGIWLCKKYVGYPNPLDDEASVIKFFLLGGPIACLISASLAVTTLYQFGAITIEQSYFSWWTWWVGDSIGILMFAPLVLLFIGEPKIRWRRRIYSIGLPITFLMSCVIILFIEVSHYEQNRIDSEFTDVAKGLTNRIHEELNDDIEILEYISGFYNSVEHIDNNAFDSLTNPILDKNKAIHALSFNQRVEDNVRDEYVQQYRSNGFPKFDVRERQHDGSLGSANKREFYYPVTYINPLKGNESAIGFDVASQISRLVALQKAAHQNNSVITSPISLVQDNKKIPAVLGFQPVYHFNKKATKENIKGMIVVIYRINDLVSQILTIKEKKWINIKISDTDPDLSNNILFDGFQNGSNSKLAINISYAESINLGSRQWKIEIVPTSTLINNLATWHSWVVLAAGLLLTSLVTAFLLVSTGKRARVEALVVTRTKELDIANQNAQKWNDLLSTIGQAQSDFISDRDTKNMFNRLLEDLLSITDSEYGFIGEVQKTGENKPYLKTHAITDISWSEETQQFYQDNALAGMEFYNLDTLFGNVMTSKKYVISNNPMSDSRKGGIPEGHPPLNSFLGIPFFKKDQMLGMVGIANRANGYDDSVIEYLNPFLSTCANIISSNRAELYRIEQENIIAERESRLRAIVDGAVESIITFDESGNIESVNDATLGLFGYDEEKLSHKSIIELIPPDQREWFAEELVSYNVKRESSIIGKSSQIDMLRSDSSRFPVVIAISNVSVSDVHLFTAIIHDVTERQRLDKMKNDFISTVSHELRTPLTSISGTLGLIEGGAIGPVSEKVQDLVQIALRNAKRLVRLVNDILDVQKFEYSNIDIRLSNQAILPIIITAIDSTQGFAEKYQVKLNFESHIDETQTAEVEQDRLTQVLTNLISNAIKFSNESGEVTIKVKYENDRIRVEVSDNGNGIPVEFQKRIFTKFAQADTSLSKTHQQGTGLGLSIAKTLIERMHGEIGFTTEVGKGTIFYFLLPKPKSEKNTGNLADVS